MSLLLVDRFHPRLRNEQQAAIASGCLLKRDEMELLEPEQLRPLARLSLFLLLIGTLFFVGLDLIADFWQGQAFSGVSFVSISLWIVLNILGYLLVLPIHEAIHALLFLFWGGKPYFGTKLPLALYCGAKDQLFRRNHYLVVGLAPLIVITLAAIVLTLFASTLAGYTLLASAGNFSGAAGDIIVARRLLRQPQHVLVEDTEVGYKVWEITTPLSS